ncbi:MAG: alpha/beta hydrolase [Woeseiaceae bacterium]|nr:alpha/beta hydrolase [Woeseiaceae bacterium]
MGIDDIYEPRRRPTTRRLDIRGIDYALTEWGDANAPLLVYLHGFGDCGATFQFVVDEFSSDWFVVAPDWRGFGSSAVTTRAFWFPDYLADLDHLLQHYSPDEPVRLVGHSMGGNVAGLYGGARPDRVAALVNLEGFGLPEADPEDAPRRYHDWLEKGRSPQGHVERPGFEALTDAILRRSPRLTRDRAGFVARCWAEELAGGQVRLRMHPAHKLPNPVLYRRAEAEACWRAVMAEVLLVAGRRSDFPPPHDLPFPRARAAWVEDSGHMLHFEQPAAVAGLIDDFLVNSSSTV